jgi:hypothetical protein
LVGLTGTLAEPTGYLAEEGSALGGEAAPRIRLAPGQIEVLPLPGALSCIFDRAQKKARFRYPKTMIPPVANRKSGEPRFVPVWIVFDEKQVKERGGAGVACPQKRYHLSS